MQQNFGSVDHDRMLRFIGQFLQYGRQFAGMALEGEASQAATLDVGILPEPSFNETISFFPGWRIGEFIEKSSVLWNWFSNKPVHGIWLAFGKLVFLFPLSVVPAVHEMAQNDDLIDDNFLPVCKMRYSKTVRSVWNCSVSDLWQIPTVRWRERISWGSRRRRRATSSTLFVDPSLPISSEREVPMAVKPIQHILNVIPTGFLNKNLLTSTQSLVSRRFFTSTASLMYTSRLKLNPSPGLIS